MTDPGSAQNAPFGGGVTSMLPASAAAPVEPQDVGSRTAVTGKRAATKQEMKARFTIGLAKSMDSMLTRLRRVGYTRCVTTPLSAGFCMPAEWSPHACTWLAWPSDAGLWREHLEPARAAFARLAAAIAADGSGETVNILVPDAAKEAVARAAVGQRNVAWHHVPFGDIWLRDTAPLFLGGPGGEVAAARFGFNGWGGKYVLDHDDRVSERIADLTGLRSFASPFVLEGGAV